VAARTASHAQRREAGPARPSPAGVRRASRARRVGAAATGAAATAAAPSREGEGGGGGHVERPKRARSDAVASEDELPQPLRAARDAVEVVPAPMRVALVALAALSIVLGIGYLRTLLRSRRLARQRGELLADVGALEAALLPAVPERLPALRASVAYRPADGPAAGGDFYDVFPLADERTAIVIGDVSGHGRAVLGRAAVARHTLRANLEAGLEPPEALQIADSVLVGNLGGNFVTALIALHDARAGTLAYAAAGHPAPIVLANGAFEPLRVGHAPPLGVGPGAGRRQTIVPFPRGAVACLYTDGLTEAGARQRRLGSARLERMLSDLGPDATAEQLIERVAAFAGTITDDAAACVIRAEASPPSLPTHTEQIELTRAELGGPHARRFLEACRLTLPQIAATERSARAVARRSGRAIVRIRMRNRPLAEVSPPTRPPDDETPAPPDDRVRVES